MNFWLCIDKDRIDGLGEYDYGGTRETVNRGFNISHGLEPMKYNVFEYVIEEIISTMFYGSNDYLCVSYTPTREDGVEAIQTARPQIDERLNTEIVVSDNNSERGFRIYNKKDMTIKETINLFREVLVEYKSPDLAGWEDVTEIVNYIE